MVSTTVVSRQKLPGFAVVQTGKKVFATEYATASNGKLPLLEQDNPKFPTAKPIFGAVRSKIKRLGGLKNCVDVAQAAAPNFDVVYVASENGRAERIVFVPKQKAA